MIVLVVVVVLVLQAGEGIEDEDEDDYEKGLRARARGDLATGGGGMIFTLLTKALLDDEAGTRRPSFGRLWASPPGPAPFV